MTEGLRRLTTPALSSLASALRAGKLKPPFTGAVLRRFVNQGEAEAVASELGRLTDDGMAPRHAALLLEEIGARGLARRAGVGLELVWTGPEIAGTQSRDTSVVVRELFRSAERSVLVASYAVFQGRQVFAPLAERMDAIPALRVQLFLHVGRPSADPGLAEAEFVRRFVRDFESREWPGSRLPEIYCDPRTVTPGGGPRTSLHAKCVVIDDCRAFVTSANFTEAAQERNIEAGVLMDDAGFALALRHQFESLVSRGALLRA